MDRIMVGVVGWEPENLKMDGSKGLGRTIGQEGNRTERQKEKNAMARVGRRSGEWIGLCMLQEVS